MEFHTQYKLLNILMSTYLGIINDNTDYLPWQIILLILTLVRRRGDWMAPNLLSASTVISSLTHTPHTHFGKGLVRIG